MNDIVFGLIACFISSIAFGVMFVPIKNYDTGDGIFVQWVMGAGIFFVGVIAGGIDGFSEFYPLAMVSGVLWATGNVTAVPIIQCIGMALGVLVWSSTNLLFGWASGRFGLFGLLAKETPVNPALNYVGLVLSAISAVIFIFVKSRPTKGRGHLPAATESANREEAAYAPLVNNADDDEPILTNGAPDSEDIQTKPNGSVADDHSVLEQPVETKIVASKGEFLPFLTAKQKRVAGLVTSLFAGAFYGLCFAPVIYIQDHRNCTTPENQTAEFVPCPHPEYKDASKEGLPYVFASYCGIFLTTTIFMLIYCLVTRNRPYVNAELVLPAFCTGLLWGVGQAGFFVANAKLSEAVSFPIISRLPGVICALLGVFYYREITGKRNLLILLLATVVTILGGILSGLSGIVL